VTLTYDSLLTTSLAVAVPLWIEQMRPLTFDQIQARAQACSHVVAEQGDLILFKSNKPGKSANAFNRLAEGIACLAFSPGGVTVAHLHWQACCDAQRPSTGEYCVKPPHHPGKHKPRKRTKYGN
jgi:hypothetical protein